MVHNSTSLVFWCAIALVMSSTKAGNLMVSSPANYDYRDALAKAILFFEGQRSGKLPASQRVKWRGDSALSDGKPENVNLIGGYYDAGDNVKFGWPMAFSMSLLSWTAIEFKAELVSTNQMDQVLRSIRWGTDFFLKAHIFPSILYTQIGDGNADHNCWERPEDMDTPRTLYKITSDYPGSEAAAEASAALSSASIVFKGVDSNYSARLIRASKSLFKLADQHRGSYKASCPFYCSYSGYQDELLWAATWLYKASGGNKYLNYVLNNKGWSQSVTEFSWDNKFVGAQALLAKEFYSGRKDLEKYKSDAESFLCAVMPGSSSLQIKTTPGGLLYIRDSANLQYVTSTTMVLFIYSNILKRASVDGVQCGSAHFSASQIRAFAKSQVDYILGNNPMKMSYVVGFGSKYPTQLHHRGSSIPSIKVHRSKVGCKEGQSNYYPLNKPNPNTHVGAVVGGPDSNDHFNDLRSDYSHLEPTTYLNAAFVGSVAALVTQSKEASVQFPHISSISDMVAYA